MATLFLNEPETLNALGKQLKRELLSVLNELEFDSSLHTIILAGKGKAFCAGGDVKGMANDPYDPIEIKRNIEISTRIVERIRNMPKLVIAAIHGYAAGAGLSLALASDMILAEEGTKLILSFKNVGLTPDLGIHYHLPRLVGEWKAKEWIWEGMKLTAEDSLKYGFIKEIVPKGEVHNRAFVLAQQLSEGPVQVFIESKLMINKSSNLKMEDILAKENEMHVIMRGTPEHKEGLAAFFEKRSPKFKS